MCVTVQMANTCTSLSASVVWVCDVAASRMPLADIPLTPQ